MALTTTFTQKTPIKTALPALLRRHRPACDAHRPADSYSTEAEERRHGWKKCDCKIYAHGTLNGVFKKLATKARDWDFARQVLGPYLAAGRWDIDSPCPSPSSPCPSPASGGEHLSLGAKHVLPIADAIKSCLKEQEAARAAPNTLKKYREILGELERFAQRVGLRYLTEWEPAYTRELRASWQVSPLTASKKLGYVKAFFEIFVEDGTLRTNPARIKSRLNRALRTRGDQVSAQKNPFTDEELERMLAACRSYGLTPRRWPKKRDGRQVVAITEYRDYHARWTGEDLADFIQISVHTGLRISDVATFEISRLTEAGQVKLRATKNGNWVCVWIPEWLRHRIRLRAQRVGPQIFGAHSTTDLNVITDIWRRKLKRLWASSGPWAQKPAPHRFRHTFVRILLERHVPLSVIADLIGDTEQMIRRHYAAWMPGRQESADRILEEAFRHVPRFHSS